jgi:Ras-related protein Rab-1A
MVGKTSLINRLHYDKFSFSGGSNVQDYVISELIVNSKSINLYIWDTGGQERFRVITSSFYRGTQAVIYAFDVGEYSSFLNCEKWIMEGNRYLSECDVCQIIVGTKCDIGGKRIVSNEEANSFAKRMGLCYFETSSKDNIGIKDTFIFLASLIIDQYGYHYEN